MLKLLLDHDYRQQLPAVDASPFCNHGVILDATHRADGSQPGTGALRFDRASSSVRIPLRPCWQRIGSLVVEAVVRITPKATRRNIVEGDGSFALFVDQDDTIVGSVYSLSDGNTTPTWNTVSSATHSPDGVVQKVPLDRWSKILFQHDGITRARVFVDDRLVAVRGDYRSGVQAVASTGIVIGNWTLTSQYAFAGDIDRVRVWKRDEEAIVREFTDRLDPQARDEWDAIGNCLHRSLNADQLMLLRRLFEQWEELLRELFRTIHRASAGDRALVLSLLREYRTNWRGNQLGAPASVDAFHRFFEILVRLLGPQWIRRAGTFAKALIDLLAAANGCFDRERLATLDCAFVAFMAEAADRVIGCRPAELSRY